MECTKCKTKITKPINCNICENPFCSSICLINHFTQNHQKMPNKPISQLPIKNKPPLFDKTKKHKKPNCPFITEGIYNPDSSPFDSILFSHLTQVQSKGQPILLGNGTFGHVWLYKDLLTSKLYAVKHMNKQRLSSILNSLTPIYNEINIQSSIEHPNIIRLYDVNESKNSFNLVLEYANSGTLFTYIKRKRGLSEGEAFKFFIQICNAIYFLHQNELIHRDLKPENILMNENETVKLTDFGWCVKLASKNRSTFCGTYEYMAPEIIEHSNYDKGIDIWSLGVLLYELIHGFSPFRAMKNKSSQNEIIINIKNHKLEFKKKVSSECEEIIREMLNEDINQRIKIEGILESKFVRKYSYSLKDKNLTNNYEIKRKQSEIETYKERKLKSEPLEEEIREDNRTKSFDKKVHFHSKSQIPQYIQNIIQNNFEEMKMEREALIEFNEKIQNNKIQQYEMAKEKLSEMDFYIRTASSSLNNNNNPIDKTSMHNQTNIKIIDLLLSGELNIKPEVKGKNKIVKKFTLNNKLKPSSIRIITEEREKKEAKDTNHPIEDNNPLITDNFLLTLTNSNLEMTQRRLEAAIDIVDKAK